MLLVDFGTTNTVAMLASGERPRLVAVDGAPWLPSAVFAGPGGLVTGSDALRMGRGDPARLEPRPKTRLADTGIRLGEKTFSPVELVRAVLRRVCDEAARQSGAPVGDLVLTHPADWGPDRIGRLLEAAEPLADRVSTVVEPVAAAAGAGVSHEETVAVVDFGGGTCDVAVVRGSTVLGAGGLPALGGDDLDRRVLDFVRSRSADSPVFGSGPASPRILRQRATLLDSARAAKELLSRHEKAEVAVPGQAPVPVDRAEFEGLVSADLDAVPALVDRVCARAGVRPERLLLVGGSSRIPLLAKKLSARGPITVDPEPETAVARGAALPAPEVSTVERRRPVRWAWLAAVAVVLLSGVGVVATRGPVPVEGVAAPAFAPVPANEAALPPRVPGQRQVNTGAPQYLSARFGEPVRYTAPRTGTALDVTMRRAEVTTAPPGPYGAAPAGFRWVLAEAELRHVSGPAFEGAPMYFFRLADDRGQLFGAWSCGLAEGCAQAEAPSDRLEPGQRVDAHAVFLVPQATPVTTVLFGNVGARTDPKPPVALPVRIPATGTSPAPLRPVGRLGGPGGEAWVGTEGTGTTVRARFDVTEETSGYLPEGAPLPGMRYVVLRAALTAIGSGELSATDVGNLYLRDDRGLPIEQAAGYGRVSGCRPLTDAVAPGKPVAGCAVFAVAITTPVTGVTFGSLATLDITRWPSWVVS